MGKRFTLKTQYKITTKKKYINGSFIISFSDPENKLSVCRYIYFCVCDITTRH